MTYQEFNDLDVEEQAELILSEGILLYEESNATHFKEVYKVKGFTVELSAALSMAEEVEIVGKEFSDKAN